MINFTRKPRYGYEDLLEIIRLLRSPEGCPWDRVQTHQSIRRGMLEEAYEAAEAIDTDNAALLKEELGDVLMQVVFHAGIEADAGRFDMDDVCDGVVKKLLYRHPHVFGDGQAETADTVPASWEQLKRQEKGQKTTADALDAVARSLPGLWRAAASSIARKRRMNFSQVPLTAVSGSTPQKRPTFTAANSTSPSSSSTLVPSRTACRSSAVSSSSLSSAPETSANSKPALAAHRRCDRSHLQKAHLPPPPCFRNRCR